MKIFYIDLFSGAGGTTTGIHLADNSDIKVVACVNHDVNAIESHKANHPDCIHFVEDVRDFKVVLALKKLVKQLREDHPGCLINIWASLECTNYSKAKGGLPRDADSRTLANSLFMYLEHLKPDYLWIENVREFMAWGPLDKKGKPLSHKNGRDYIAWTKTVQSYGYDFDWKLLNAADYGAYTSRERYFAQFAKEGLPIRWPEQTHCKDPKGDLFEKLPKWKPVREVLDMEDEGQSIFTRKKPLVDKTLERIYAGLIKFVAGGEDAFLKKYYSGRPKGKVISVNGPAGTITTVDHHHLVQPTFLLKYNSMNRNGKYQAPDINEPCPVVSTQGRLGVVNPSFLTSYYGNTKEAHSDQRPCPTVTTKDRFNKVQAQFLTHYYSGGGQVSSPDNPAPVLTGIPKARLTSCQFIDQQYGQSKPTSPDQPAGSITSNPKLNLVNAQWMLDPNYNNTGQDLDGPAPSILACRKHRYLVNPQFNSKGSSIEEPCFTLIARMDKRPPQIVQVDHGQVVIAIYEDDSEIMQKIKEFMALYGIIDIKMRMLKIPELLRIQGFPENYVLKGTQTEQKKYIGNAVVTIMAKALVQTNADAIMSRKEEVSA